MGVGVLAIACSVWARMLVALLGGQHFTVLTHVGGYRPAEFTVERLVYQAGQRRGSTTSPTRYWAEGTVNGHKERFGLGAYLPKIPGSLAELEGMMAIGRVLPVLYNPEVPDTIEARVLYPDRDFPARWLIGLHNLYKFGFGPLAVALALCLLFSLVDRSWLGVKFAVGCLPFPVLGLLFALLDLPG